ncbi:MAG: hypothetical protein ACUVUE_05730 [Candidatus Bathycorpusculaceae bacterium]
MRAIFKSYSGRQVSIRFAAQVFDSPLHFNRDSRIYSICDYIALNWYEDHCSRELFPDVVREIRRHTKVIVSEFDLGTDNDTLQAEMYRQYIELFKSVGIQDCIAWFWRADHPTGNPGLPGTSFNLAKTADGEPRPAFCCMINSGA